MAIEVALSVILVVIADNCWAVSGVKLINTDPGFDAGHVLASVVLPAPNRYPNTEQRTLFFKRIFESILALPGVESAGVVDALPFSGEDHGAFVSDGATQLDSEIDIIGGQYLQTMGLRLLEGRWFRDEEMSDASDTAIVNDLIASRLWPGVSAVGQRICVYCTPERPNDWKRVIGVVSSASHSALNEPMNGEMCIMAAGAMREGGVHRCQNRTADGRFGTGHSPCDCRRRSEPARVPHRVHERPDRRFGRGSAVHYDHPGHHRLACFFDVRCWAFMA